MLRFFYFDEGRGGGWFDSLCRNLRMKTKVVRRRRRHKGRRNVFPVALFKMAATSYFSDVAKWVLLRVLLVRWDLFKDVSLTNDGAMKTVSRLCSGQADVGFDPDRSRILPVLQLKLPHPSHFFFTKLRPGFALGLKSYRVVDMLTAFSSSLGRRIPPPLPSSAKVQGREYGSAAFLSFLFLWSGVEVSSERAQEGNLIFVFWFICTNNTKNYWFFRLSVRPWCRMRVRFWRRVLMWRHGDGDKSKCVVVWGDLKPALLTVIEILGWFNLRVGASVLRLFIDTSWERAETAGNLLHVWVFCQSCSISFPCRKGFSTLQSRQRRVVSADLACHPTTEVALEVSPPPLPERGTTTDRGQDRPGS